MLLSSGHNVPRLLLHEDYRLQASNVHLLQTDLLHDFPNTAASLHCVFSCVSLTAFDSFPSARKELTSILSLPFLRESGQTLSTQKPTKHPILQCGKSGSQNHAHSAWKTDMIWKAPPFQMTAIKARLFRDASCLRSSLIFSGL